MQVPCPQPAVTISLLSDDEVVTVVAFFNDDGQNIEVACATSRPGRGITRALLKKFGHYAFEQTGHRRVTARVEDGNDASLALLHGMGFKDEGKLREASPDGKDIHILGMLREEFRYG